MTNPSDPATPSLSDTTLRSPRTVSLRDYGILASLVALFVFLSFASDVFLSQRNMLNVLEQSAAVGIVAAGGTMVIISGGFDLSVGGIFALSSVVAAMAANQFGVVFGWMAGLAVGIIVGVINGLLVTVVRINAFITTLAMMIIVRGIAVSLTGGFLIPVDNELYELLGRQGMFGVKYSIWLLLLFALACGILLSRTVLGRHIYAAGGNPEAARLSGVPVARVRTIAFAISGFSAALAGVIISSRVANGQADAGQGLEFSAIAAIVVGGTSIFGGEGAIWRTMVGVFFLALIGNGFNLLAVPATYQQIFQGLIILLAVGIDLWARR